MKHTPPLKYEVLEKWECFDKKAGLCLLVDKKTKKEQAIKLIKYLIRKHDNLLLIDIYTSKEAFKHRNDFKYSVDRYFSGYLMHAFSFRYAEAEDECQITSFIKQ